VSLDLRDCTFFGPALPEPFVKFHLEGHLLKRKLLPKNTGSEGRELQESWEVLRRKLRDLGVQGGAVRVANHLLEPLAERLGYATVTRQETVETREGEEDGGWLLQTKNGDARLRAWAVGVGTDLDAPQRRGRAYRFSPSRIAQRVLLAGGERVGLLTDGEELRLLVCDPARPDSHVVVRLDRAGGWRARQQVPDSYRLILALASPEGVRAVPDLVLEARLAQTGVTRKLRQQARAAVERFIQAVLDDPHNADTVRAWTDPQTTARQLWQEGLVLVYRLLFTLKLESAADPARAFSFASQALWRQTYSPAVALAPIARQVLDHGADSGAMLADGLRALFRPFAQGLESSELAVKPLGGALFGADATPLLGPLKWSEQAVALLLDSLLWTPGDGKTERERVHYGALDVEDLGRVYEALLELEPGIATEPMCRLRRNKLEVVLPAAQGNTYRPKAEAAAGATASDSGPLSRMGEGQGEGEETDSDEEDEEPDTGKPGKKASVVWIEDIAPGRFFLRVGLGRKASGSYYTPHAFVRFLVQETLGPQVEERSPRTDPQPAAILSLRVLDPAMGSGHFLVEACRFLGDALYEACRLCDELALDAEAKAERAQDETKRQEHAARAVEMRARVELLPDPEDELVAYLPSRVPEGEETGLSQRKAEALCRRLVAVHCLYGVDKNPLAVELAKLSLWLESYAEGLPLTFLDHRLVCGDSLTGPFAEHLATLPVANTPMEGLWTQQFGERLQERLGMALLHVTELEATIGTDVADVEQKRTAKGRLETALAPFRTLAAAWTGGVMLGANASDDDYEALAKAVVTGRDVTALVATRPTLRHMVETGREGLPYDLAFPEVFHPGGAIGRSGGFDGLLGNPPWDRIEVSEEDFWCNYDLSILDCEDKKTRAPILARLAAESDEARLGWQRLQDRFACEARILCALYKNQAAAIGGGNTTGRPDLYKVFAERGSQVITARGYIGWLMPGSIHANEGATGIRRLYLEDLRLICCYSFENRRKLFEIDSRQKFAVVVAARPGPTEIVRCAFYLDRLEWLFGEHGDRELRYSLEDIKHIGGEYLTLPECRSKEEAGFLKAVFGESTRSIESLSEELHLTFAFGVELHRNPEFNTRLPLSLHGNELSLRPPTPDSLVPVLEGKHVTHFSDSTEYRIETGAPFETVISKSKWNPSIAFYRLAFREVASSTNERTLTTCVLPPGRICNHTLGVETSPKARPSSVALWICGLLNAHFTDWQVRKKAGMHVSAFIFRAIRLPARREDRAFLVHAALRLCCNHPAFFSLWREQVGEVWREPTPPLTWPVLAGADVRWAVRSAIDAVVAQAYGLDRAQYAHVLASFSHTSYRAAPVRCLAAFDELTAIGLDAFVQRHDPYHDIPLVETLPQPVIDLPEPSVAAAPPRPGRGRGRKKPTQEGLF